ncbi:MAG: hypothetical protein WBP81_13730, partial [Solirubrobacteraceae bacterium]
KRSQCAAPLGTIPGTSLMPGFTRTRRSDPFSGGSAFMIGWGAEQTSFRAIWRCAAEAGPINQTAWLLWSYYGVAAFTPTG